MSIMTAGPSAGADLPKPEFAKSLGRLQLRGFGMIALFLGTIGVWSVTATLTGAVAVPGQFVVENSLKRVQHMQGGVIGSLSVAEGDHVTAGEIVMRLDPTVLQASRQIVFKQLDELTMRRVRLEAERDGSSTIALPERFATRRGDPAVEALIQSETRLLDVKRSVLEGRRMQLRKRIDQSGQQVVGLEAQLNAKRSELKIIKIDLENVTELFKKRLVQANRYSAVQRDNAIVEGQIGNIIAAIAEAQGKIAETELQILQLTEDDRADASGQLRDVEAQLNEYSERLVAADDQLKRVDIRAPVSGIVHELAVHTVGGVLAPGETAMQIVPDGDQLQVEAHIAPSDVDQVTVGQVARVKLKAGNQRMMPEVKGQVVRLSADTIQDQRTGATYYPIRVEIPPEELKKAEGLTIIAGMQTEVFVETSSRTPFEFLMKPLEEQFDRTFRER